MKAASSVLVGIVALGGLLFLLGVDPSKLGDLAKYLPEVSGPTAGESSGDSGGGPPPRATTRVRVASFNIQVFGQDKLGDANVMEVLARVVRQFDVVAIQEIRSKSQDVMPRFLELINSTGAHYDYAISPRLGRTTSMEQYAFVYDTTTLEVDRDSMYVVGDPDDLLHREPFVGGFRVRGQDAQRAFTFTLVNIHTDPDEVALELNALDDVFRAVRNDGRGEDDVILLGDLNTDDQHLGDLGAMPNVACAIYGQTTNTRRTQQYDNLIFDKLATTEFTGRYGVVDLCREFNLSLENALKVSDHCPVWAEFDVIEGGSSGPQQLTSTGTKDGWY
ncbi:MAG TPA: endonuclease/exonuclease/phosphatase family protein [Pirellulales bacterium]